MLVAAGDPGAAAGTNIAISAAASATGGYRQAREGRVSWRVVRGRVARRTRDRADLGAAASPPIGIALLVISAAFAVEGLVR